MNANAKTPDGIEYRFYRWCAPVKIEWVSTQWVNMLREGLIYRRDTAPSSHALRRSWKWQNVSGRDLTAAGSDPCVSQIERGNLGEIMWLLNRDLMLILFYRLVSAICRGWGIINCIQDYTLLLHMWIFLFYDIHIEWSAALTPPHIVDEYTISRRVI